MSLTQDQEIALLLGGAVRLPGPAPATGVLSILPPASSPTEPGQIFLRIDHPVSPRLKISRVVRLLDVRAASGIVRAVKSAKSPATTPAEPSQLTDRQLVAAAVERLAKAGKSGGAPIPWMDRAVLYLPESAPVLMTVEAGLTAAESAEYYPPLGRSTTVSAPTPESAPLAEMLGKSGARLFGGGIDPIDSCHPEP